MLADGVVEVGRVAASLGIDCWYHRDGILGVRSGAWQEETSPHDDLPEPVRATTETLDAAGARAIADSPRFLGGVFNTDSGICQPARLARGLRRVLLERGVHVFERTPMTGLDRERPAIVRTDRGAVRARHVVLTTGAWAADLPPFRRSFGVISDHVVATERMPERLQEIGWTTHAAICDRREWLYYLRPTDDGRIVIGGGAGGAVYGGRGNSRAAGAKRHFAEVAARGLLEMFPQLEGIRFTHAWGGPIDQTPTFLPFYRTLDPGNVHAGLGFSGHGLVQTFVGGQILASTVLGLDDEWTSLRGQPAGGRAGAARAVPVPGREGGRVRARAWRRARGGRGVTRAGVRLDRQRARPVSGTRRPPRRGGSVAVVDRRLVAIRLADLDRGRARHGPRGGARRRHRALRTSHRAPEGEVADHDERRRPR